MLSAFNFIDFKFLDEIGLSQVFFGKIAVLHQNNLPVVFLHIPFSPIVLSQDNVDSGELYHTASVTSQTKGLSELYKRLW